jgi:phosphoesterase RecJ-like protein
MSDTLEIARHLSEILFSARRVLVTTHVRPDGDALGSAAGVVRGLTSKGIAAEVLLLSHLPRKYAFIFEDAKIPYRDVEDGWPRDFALDDYDCLLVVDTGTWSQLPGLQEQLANWSKPKLVIDHHLTQQDWANVKLVDTSAGACCEIIATLLERWGVALDAPTAQALFVGIVADTGWFMFSNTRPVTLRLGARLMEAGVDTDRIYQLLYQSERPERVALHARGLASLELLDEGRVAMIRIGKDDFAATGAHPNDTENLINFPLQIRTVQVSILLTDPPAEGSRAGNTHLPGKTGKEVGDAHPSGETRKEVGGAHPTGTQQIRASFRSKGQVDVAKFAQQFGGGGHARAAGAKFDDLTLEQAHERILGALKDHPELV